MQKQCKYNGRVVAYECLGAGARVVLLHGFGETGAVWGFQKVLAQQFQLLIPDLPGSGASEMIQDMSLEGLADAVHFMLLEEGIQQCVMIGHSMGGYIALAFAEKYPDMLTGFGFFHSSAFADNDEKKSTRKKGIAFIKEQGAANFLKTAAPNLFSPATKEHKPSLLSEHLKTINDFSKEALIAYYEAMIQRPDRTAVLRNLAVPVLFLLGKWDGAVPLQDGLSQCYLPQTAYIHLLHHSGHMGLVEEPEKSNAFLNQYLTETVSRL